MTRTRAAISWLLALIVVAGVGMLPETPAVARLQELVLLPGMLVAVFGWPQGVHTGSGASAGSVAVMFAAIYAVSIAFWGGVLYLVQRAWLALRRHRM